MKLGTCTVCADAFEFGATNCPTCAERADVVAEAEQARRAIGAAWDDLEVAP